MTQARKFPFGRDFRESALTSEQAAARNADEAGYARGLADGQRLAAEAAAAKLAAAMEKLAALANALLAQEAARAAAAEADAAALALVFAEKIAGEALTRAPLAALEETARDCFRHLRGVPHLVVRISAALVEEADAVMKRAAHQHGFDGKVVVLGDPDIAPGDVKLEWADGGVVRDRKILESAVAEAVARTLQAGSPINDGEA